MLRVDEARIIIARLRKRAKRVIERTQKKDTLSTPSLEALQEEENLVRPETNMSGK